jgi:aminopeptidase N
MTKKVARLFAQFQPENYKLEIEADKSNKSFSGTVRITGKKVGRPSKRITLHQAGLTITAARVVKHDKHGEDELTVARINTHGTFDELRLHFNEMIYPGRYFIELSFSGLISQQMNGIYLSTFDHQGKTKQLVATQFESHYAREAFPCIDEPEAKATFDLTLITDTNEVVVANTPIVEEDKRNGKLITTFDTTPKMSTYLLAFVHGELGFTQARTKDGTLVSVYATPDNKAHTAFALDCAVKTLEFYNDYFDVPYPLDKCDFIALPDFASGAMENWGCITFREQALLVDPKNTSLHLKQYVANVIAHELTHQWFGNLVTMRWWTDLWLNESFASWMSYLAVDHLFPDWHVWTQFIYDEQGLALKQDALEHTHPIEVEVNHPDEIRTIFDAISYEKGASVILMLHDYLGPEVFRDGMRLYLKRHAYSNTDTVDLWAALEEVSKLPVASFMGQWTSLSGYPLVHANLSGDTPTIKQERFYLNPGAKKDKSVWPIPLRPSHGIELHTFDRPEIALEPAHITDRTVFNHDRTSFFRVIYDQPHRALLAQGIESGHINELDRLGIIEDSFEAAKAGYESTVSTLELMQAYSNETSSVVWDVIASAIGSIRLVMEDDELRPDLKRYVRKLTTQQFDRLGWEEQKSDSHFDKLLRPTILGLASYGENPEVVDEALRRFDAMSKPEDVHPDIRGVIYGTVARNGGKTEFDKMMALHNQSTNSEERVTLSGSLTGFQQPKLIQLALSRISSKDVRPQDSAYWIAYSFSNRFARQATWEWMKDNWDWLITNLGTDLSFFRMPVYAGRVFSDREFIPEFKDFFMQHMSPAFERPVKQGIETIEWQAAWKERDQNAIKKFF